MKAKYGWSANALDGKLPKEVQDCKRDIWLEAPQEHVFGKHQAEYVLASDDNITDKMGDITIDSEIHFTVPLHQHGTAENRSSQQQSSSSSPSDDIGSSNWTTSTKGTQQEEIQQYPPFYL